MSTWIKLHKAYQMITDLYFYTSICPSGDGWMTPVEQLTPPIPPSLSPPPLYILSYADLFMNTHGSGDHLLHLV